MHNDRKQLTRLQGVDVLRVIAIIAVISIHTTPFASSFSPIGQRLDIATVINQMARFAVPLFFVLSGYFWARKTKCDRSIFAATLPSLRKIAVLTLSWSIIYLFPLKSAAFDYGIDGPLKTMYWNLGAAMHRPLELLLEGTMYHLWFLPALGFSLLISSVLLHFEKRFLLVLLAIALYMTGLAGSAYSATPFGFKADFNFRNGPFLSLIFFVSGYFLYHRKVSKAWLPIGVAITAAGALVHFCEIIMLNREWGLPMTQDYVFGTYFFGLGVAIIALSNSSVLRIPQASSIGPLVLGIYASHIIFVKLFSPLEEEFKGGAIWSVTYVAVVFFLSYFFARFLSRFQATKKLVM